MFRFFRKHRAIVMVALALCILGLLLFGIGGSFMGASPNDTIIKINGKKVTQMEYDRLYNQLSRQKTDLSPEQRDQLAGQAFQELVRQEVFYQEAKKYGIVVSDQELQLQIRAIPAFQKDGQFDPATYMQVISQMFGAPIHEFEKVHRKDLMARQLNAVIASAVHVTDAELQSALSQRLATETDKKKKKQLQENPELLREELRQKEANIVFSDWLTQLNANLKVNVVSETFRKRIGAPAQ